jgi:hypothetical protein
MRDSDYTPEMWQKVGPAQKQLQAEMKPLGKFLGLTLIDRATAGTQRSYFYLLDFQNARVLQRYVLDDQNKLALIHSEFFEAKLKD